MAFSWLSMSLRSGGELFDEEASECSAHELHERLLKEPQVERSTYWESIFVVLPCFSGYAALFGLQHEVKAALFFHVFSLFFHVFSRDPKEFEGIRRDPKGLGGAPGHRGRQLTGVAPLRRGRARGHERYK